VLYLEGDPDEDAENAEGAEGAEGDTGDVEDRCTRARAAEVSTSFTATSENCSCSGAPETYGCPLRGAVDDALTRRLP